MRKIEKVFIGIPQYREWSVDYEVYIPEGETVPGVKKMTKVRRFLIDCMGFKPGGFKPWIETHPEDGLYFQDGGTTGINTTFATSSIAEDFANEPLLAEFDWLLWWASDQTMNPSDIRLMIDCARRFETPVIGGIVTTRKKPPVILAGNFDPEKNNEVRFFRRGLEILDTDVSNKRTKKCEVFGGGGLIHRSVLEKFRPELNDGKAYFCYDRQTPSYDWRFFQRLKEKGIRCAVQCGALITHWGLNEKGEETGYGYYESLIWNAPKAKRNDFPEDWPETLKPEVGAAV